LSKYTLSYEAEHPLLRHMLNWHYAYSNIWCGIFRSLIWFNFHCI